MFLQLSAQELVLGNRREFSERSLTVILRVVAAAPFDGQCHCCSRLRGLTGRGRPVPGAEYDHFFHCGLNRPEHGWLVCADCHAELTHGGCLVRFTRIPEFRAFQGAVLEHRPPGAHRSLRSGELASTPALPNRRARKSPMTSIRGHGAFRV